MNFFLKYRKVLALSVGFMLFFQLSAYNTIHYDAKNGIASNAIHRIYIDNTHRIWLGTNNGISCLTGSGITNYGYKDGLTSNGVRYFYQTTDGRFWISSNSNGIYEMKNNRFYNSHFTFSDLSNQCGQLIEYKGWLLIGSEQGVHGLHLKTNQFYRFPAQGRKKPLEGVRFFNWKDDLYAQSFIFGTFKVNLQTKTLDSVRYDEYLNKWNFGQTQIKDTFFLCRSKYQKNLHHNLFYGLTSDYLQGAKMDSIEISTLIWKMTPTPLGLMAACWGARDATGGLFLRKGSKMVNINEQFGLASTQVVDVLYDNELQKLYVATRDKGLYVYDFNQIVSKEKIEENEDILDLKIIGNKLFVLKKDTLSLYENGKRKKSISIVDVEKYIRVTKPNVSLKKIDIDAPDRFLDLSVSSNSVVINSNFSEIRLDLNLKIRDYIEVGSDGRLCFMKNDDALIIRYFGGGSVLCQDFGKGKHRNFNYWNKKKTNPKDPQDFCKLNDSTFLVNTATKMFIYNQHDTLYKRFDKLINFNYPISLCRYSENSFLTLDKSNILFKGNYEKDSLTFNALLDFRKLGVVESYFVKSFNGLIVVATNKGIFIIDHDKRYLVDKSFGLPDDVVIHTAVYQYNKIYLATSGGIYYMDLLQLKNIHTDYTLSNLILEADTTRISYKVLGKVNIKAYPKEVDLFWEINKHPYPEKIHYAYALGNNQKWMNVNTAGKIRIVEPHYGTTIVYLKITDDTNGKILVQKLVEIYIPKPFYLSGWFWTLIGVILTALVFILMYQNRLNLIKRKAEKAESEAMDLQMRLDLLQFLLKPHFIFNALSSVQNLMLKNEIDKSIEYTSYFAKFLRGIMQNSGEQLIPLKDEIENTLRYIELEKLRFNENVEVKLSIEDQIDTLQTLIIPFLFQPLIENMFKHAFDKSTVNPQISINIQREKDQLVFSIADNGHGLGGQSLQDILSKPESKGIKIIVAQLQKFFSDKHDIQLFEKPEGGTCWTISIAH